MTVAATAALIAAIEDYTYVPDLPGARSIGTAWLTWLTKSRGVKPVNVRTLFDAAATADVVERKAREAAALVGSRGTLWVVFIGHGAATSSGNDGLLVAVDAQESAQGVDGVVRCGEVCERVVAQGAPVGVQCLQWCERDVPRAWLSGLSAAFARLIATVRISERYSAR